MRRLRQPQTTMSGVRSCRCAGGASHPLSPPLQSAVGQQQTGSKLCVCVCVRGDCCCVHLPPHLPQCLLTCMCACHMTSSLSQCNNNTKTKNHLRAHLLGFTAQRLHFCCRSRRTFSSRKSQMAKDLWLTRDGLSNHAEVTMGQCCVYSRLSRRMLSLLRHMYLTPSPWVIHG